MYLEILLNKENREYDSVNNSAEYTKAYGEFVYYTNTETAANSVLQNEIKVLNPGDILRCDGNCYELHSVQDPGCSPRYTLSQTKEPESVAQSPDIARVMVIRPGEKPKSMLMNVARGDLEFNVGRELRYVRDSADNVAMVFDSNAKQGTAQPNRITRSGEIVYGPVVLCNISSEGDVKSMTASNLERYTSEYKNPDIFYELNDGTYKAIQVGDKESGIKYINQPNQLEMNYDEMVRAE